MRDSIYAASVHAGSVPCANGTHTQWLKFDKSAGVFRHGESDSPIRKNMEVRALRRGLSGEDFARTVRGETERLAFPLENSPGNQRVIDQILSGVAGTTLQSVRKLS